MPAATEWNFEADYLTNCNCDWGCPCNFNARPTQGNCNGLGVWRIRKGSFGATRLDGVVFAAAYFFPGLIEHGNGTARLYLDTRSSPEQRAAIEAIHSGKHGGGFFGLFPNLVSKKLPPKVARIDATFDGPNSRARIEGVTEVECGPIQYPDGSVISPTFTLPHGIEFKTGLAMNAKKWSIRDEEMLGTYDDKYAVIATVKFSNEGCVG